MNEPQGAPELTGNMFLFNKPELLAKEQHGQLGLSKPSKRYGFCSAVRAIPITVTEIPAASKDYPIIFTSKEQLLPLAVVGVVDEVNLFVDENGEWEQNRYVPGYLRRYPFGVAAETGGERMAVVIDRDYEGLTENSEFPLFENGEPTKVSNDAVEFCKAFERERQMTDDFAKRLAAFDIVHAQSAQFTPEGENEAKSFADYFGIDENKLKALADEQVVELHKSQFLPLLYAMLMSMANWRQLLARRAARYGFTEANMVSSPLN
ncbi:MAG: SapC family protein [Marinicaulis sp.]|nr:SapC family protein [Marinicaulis sp.]NNL88770.1 SapC family protein [Marinicaulis sp.]